MNATMIAIALPIALGIIMFSLGLDLTIADFVKVGKSPKAAFTALTTQILVLPVLCFGLVLAFNLPAALAVGMMLVAASPGGPTANLYSRLFGGDVAFSISLTAVSWVVAILTLPMITNASLAYFFAGDEEIGLQLGKVMQIFAIVLVPTSIGMVINRYFQRLAAVLARPAKLTSTVILIAVIIGAIASEWTRLTQYLQVVGLPVLLFSTCSVALGYWGSKLMRQERELAIASSMSIGIRNGSLAIAIAVSPALLNDIRMGIPAALYGIVTFGVAAMVGFILRPRRPSSQSTDLHEASPV